MKESITKYSIPLSELGAEFCIRRLRPQKNLFILIVKFLFLYWVFGSELAIAEPYRVGIPVPLTGDAQAYGQDIQRGYELGKELLKANDIQLLFEDDACNPAKGVGILKKLIEVDNVKAISGIFCNGVLLASAPYLNRTNIPVLTSAANTGDQHGIGKKIFRLFPADHLGVAPLIKYIAKKHKRLCMISETEAYPELIARTVKSEWGKLGSEFELFSEAVNYGEKDFRSVLLRLKQKNCEALFINPEADGGYIPAFKQAKDLKIDASMYGYYMPGSPDVQQALGEQLNGVIYATLPTQTELASKLGLKFEELYKERFGKFLVGVPVALFAFESFYG